MLCPAVNAPPIYFSSLMPQELAYIFGGKNGLQEQSKYQPFSNALECLTEVVEVLV